MKFRFIETCDPAYEKELMLRWEVLRKPLGMPPGSQVTDQEPQSLHFIAFDKKNVVGCVLFYQESEVKGRVYQMAISEEYRGRGFGRKLLANLEKALLTRGIKELALDSHDDAIGFYLQMGYQPEGDRFKAMGVYHQPMTKNL